MTACWYCLVLIENGLKVCPQCGGDQTPPPETSGFERKSLTSIFLNWIIVTVAVAFILTGLLWYVRWRYSNNLGNHEETTASKSLHDIRTALSQYAITSGDQYPSSLGMLGDRTAQPLQQARTESYEVTYTPKSSEVDRAITGFELWANPRKPSNRSFYIDESGILRATQEHRPANDRDPPI
jgi:hypothetical protein